MEEIEIKEWGKEVFDLLSWYKMEVVKNAKVMVVGAGALGNEVLKNLALFGVGNIYIVDFDTIEYTNLTRSVLFREADADGRIGMYGYLSYFQDAAASYMHRFEWDNYLIHE